MEQIITLGIGGTPASLTPFITTGLEIAAAIIVDTVTGAVIGVSDIGAIIGVSDIGAVTGVSDLGAVVMEA